MMIHKHKNEVKKRMWTARKLRSLPRAPLADTKPSRRRLDGFGKKGRRFVAISALALLLISPAFASAATITASLKPAFEADLINTLKLQAGTGNPTFTRGTTIEL